jgi:esterase/lipase superfamily enzyme
MKDTLFKNCSLRVLLIISLLIVSFFAGCTSQKTMMLMPTPVLYQNSSIDPFAHLSPEERSIHTQVFYATNRFPKFKGDEIVYGNTVDSIIHLGKATIRIGDENTDWDSLHKASLSIDQTDLIPISVAKIIEQAILTEKDLRAENDLTPQLREFVDSINAELAEAVDKEIMIYVHGTKVDFSNSVILTAEIDHFAGRDFIGVAFAWPSHQNILSYLVGTDVRRALSSSSDLQRLIVFLSKHTTAEHINILSYSAGGKVTSKALFELRKAFSELDSEELKAKFRIGAVMFAAVDVEVDIFLERISAISELAEQVVITVTDDDEALKAAKRFMGGKSRAGSLEAESIEEDYIVQKHLANVEIIDVSYGKKVRGFDITGHHYWYRHPWMSSDIVFLMRTDLPPVRRGLSASELEGIWYLSPDYPEKIRKAVEVELEGQWKN